MWNGDVETAGFTVECLENAAVGVAQCVAHIIEGSRVMRLSFYIEVVETGDAWAYADTKADLLNTKTEQVEADVAVIDPDELEVFDLVIGHGNQVGMGVATKEADLFSSSSRFSCAYVCAFARLVAPAMEEAVLTRRTQHRAKSPVPE